MSVKGKNKTEVKDTMYDLIILLSPIWLMFSTVLGTVMFKICLSHSMVTLCGVFFGYLYVVAYDVAAIWICGDKFHW